MRVRVVVSRQLRETRKQGSFGEREFGGPLVEVGLGGCVRAVGKVAIVDLVQIELQDGFFVIAATDLGREDGLFELALDGGFRREVDALDELLGDGGCARDDVAFAQGIVEGANECKRIDASVLVEVGVFRGDGGLLQVGRYFVQGDGDTPSRVGVDGLVEQVAFSVQDPCGLEGAGAADQFGRGWKAGGDDCIGDDTGACGQE